MGISETRHVEAIASKSQEIYYLKSIRRHLCFIRDLQEDLSIGSEALADNIDWLDCYIDYKEAELEAIKST